MLSRRRHTSGKWSHDERGQAIVETALVSILLLYLVMGAVDFGRVLYTYVTVTQAAKDGARKAAAYPNCRSAVTDFASVTTGSSNTTYNSIDYAVAQAAQQFSLGSGNVTVNFYTYDASAVTRTATGSAVAGGQVDVIVTAPFSPITPLAGPILGTLNISASATHLIEAAPSAC